MTKDISSGERFYGFETPPENTRLGEASKRTGEFGDPNKGGDKTWHRSHNPEQQDARIAAEDLTEFKRREEETYYQESLEVAQNWFSKVYSSDVAKRENFAEAEISPKNLANWWNETQGKIPFGEWDSDRRTGVGDAWAAYLASPVGSRAVAEAKMAVKMRAFSIGGADGLPTPNKEVNLVG